MNIDNKFLLVCLQLIIISLMSLRVEGRGLREDGSRFALFEGHMNRLFDPLSPGPSTSRTYRLYLRCSKKFVSIHDKITATANKTDCKGEVELLTVMMGGRIRTRIRGISSDRYVCFNHKGRLVSKPKKRARGAKCEFVEEISADGYSQFRSVKNGDWYIGFNLRGKPLLATAHLMTRARDKDKNCFHFLKQDPYPGCPKPPNLNQRKHHHRFSENKLEQSRSPYNRNIN